MKTPETHWRIEIAERHRDRFDRQLIHVGGLDDLSSAIAAIYESATYYYLMCGYKLSAYVEQYCVACGGDGMKRNKSGHVHVRRDGITPDCPKCRGKGTFATIEAIELNPSESIGMPVVPFGGSWQQASPLSVECYVPAEPQVSPLESKGSAT